MEDPIRLDDPFVQRARRFVQSWAAVASPSRPLRERDLRAWVRSWQELPERRLAEQTGLDPDELAIVLLALLGPRAGAPGTKAAAPAAALAD